MRLSTYNVENLFARAKALHSPGGQPQILAAQAEINQIIAQPVYSAGDKARIVQLLDQLGLLHGDDGRYAILRQNRGHLVSRAGGTTTVTASGRSDWIGWVDLAAGPVDELSTRHLAMAIRDIGADVQAVVEAESRDTLKDFSASMLPAVGGTPFNHVMLITGNDQRGINVGIMTRDPCELRTMRSHVDDTDDHGRIFSRDCAHYEIATPHAGPLVLLVNHLKSKGWGSQAANDATRLRQATRIAAIYAQLRAQGSQQVAVVGDFNEYPGGAPLVPLLSGTDLKDISTHPKFTHDGREGTYGNATAKDKIDYMLLSPGLYEAVSGGGTFRSGAWGGTNGTLWPHYPTITKHDQAASDHSALYADLDL